MSFLSWEWDADWTELDHESFRSLRQQHIIQGFREAWGRYLDASGKPDTTGYITILAGRSIYDPES